MDKQIEQKANALRLRMKRFQIKSIVGSLHKAMCGPIAVSAYDAQGRIWHVVGRNSHIIETMFDDWCKLHQDWISKLKLLPYVGDIGFDTQSKQTQVVDLESRIRMFFNGDEDLAMVFDWLSETSKSNYSRHANGHLDLQAIGNIFQPERFLMEGFWQHTDTVESILIESDLHWDAFEKANALEHASR